MDDTATIEELVTCLSGTPENAAAAIEALRRRGASAAVPAIAGLASSAHGMVRLGVVEALGTLGRDQADVAGPALVQLLADPDNYIRAEAADALGAIGYAPAAALLAEHLRTDPNATVRAAQRTVPWVRDRLVAIARDPLDNGGRHCAVIYNYYRH